MLTEQGKTRSTLTECGKDQREASPLKQSGGKGKVEEENFTSGKRNEQKGGEQKRGKKGALAPPRGIRPKVVFDREREQKGKGEARRLESCS